MLRLVADVGAGPVAVGEAVVRVETVAHEQDAGVVNEAAGE